MKCVNTTFRGYVRMMKSYYMLLKKKKVNYHSLTFELDDLVFYGINNP